MKAFKENFETARSFTLKEDVAIDSCGIILSEGDRFVELANGLWLLVENEDDVVDEEDNVDDEEKDKEKDKEEDPKEEKKKK